MKKVFVIARDVIMFAASEKWLWGLVVLMFLFLSSVNVLFLVEKPFEVNLSDIELCLQSGFFFVSIFCLLMPLLISLGVLKEYYRKERLLFFMPKPVKSLWLYLGIFCALGFIVFAVWFLMSLFLSITVLIHKHIFLLYIFQGFFPVLITGIISICLAMLAYNFYPNGISSIMCFLIFVCSFAVAITINNGYQFAQFWQSIIEFESMVLPQINRLFGMAFVWLKIADIEIDIAYTFLHSIIFIVLSLLTGAMIFDRKLKRE